MRVVYRPDVGGFIYLFQSCCTSSSSSSSTPSLSFSGNSSLKVQQVPQSIAKTGSLCCVAARPHGSNTEGDWSITPDEPYWRTNTSFSPPLSRRWDHSLQTEVLLPTGTGTGSHNNAVQLYGSSISSVSKEESRPSMMGGYHFPNHSASDGAASYFSSPSDSFQTQQWTPPPIKGFGIADLGRGSMMRGEPAPGLLTFAPSMEGTSALPYSAGSSSSRSDGSEFENIAKHVSSSRNFSGRCSFISKPIHPISFMNHAPEREASVSIASGSPFVQSILNDNGSSQHSDFKSVRSIAELQSAEFSEVVATTPRREMLQLSSASSSMDFTDVSEQFDCESIGPSRNLSEGFRCGLCERFLSQRSPWSSRRIVRSSDMPVTGVLSCCHIFHADCLEQATPKMMKQDPPCPVCSRSEENTLERQVVSRSRNGLPRVRSVVEDGPSRPWGCGQVGDCVEGALHASPRSNMLSLNRSRLKKHLSSVGTSSKELQVKLKKSGSSSQLLHGRLLTQPEAKKPQPLQ